MCSAFRLVNIDVVRPVEYEIDLRMRETSSRVITFARSKRKDAYEFKESSLRPRFICSPAGAGRHVGGDYQFVW